MERVHNIFRATVCFAILFFFCTVVSGDVKMPEINNYTFGAFIGGGKGINTPLGIWRKDVDYMKKLEFGIARFNSNCWNDLEPQKGNYQWTALDNIVNLMRRNDIEVLFTVPIASSWNTSAVDKVVNNIKIMKLSFPTRNLAHLEELCFRLADRYKNTITYWEAWNEPDYFMFWKGAPEPYEYLNVLKAMHEGLKRGNPQCKIVIGGLTKPFEKRYLERLLEYGAAEYFDIMNIHVYTKDPVEVQKKLNHVQEIMKEQGINKPIWVTEISTTPSFFMTPFREKEEEVKASFLVKSYTVLLTEGVKKIFWHTLRGIGRDAGREKDFDFSLLNSDFTILPAYRACEEFTSRLIGSYQAEKMPSEKGLRVYRFKKKDTDVYIAWAESGKKLLNLPLAPENVSVSDIFGKKIDIETGGKFKCLINSSPVYIEQKGK